MSISTGVKHEMPCPICGGLMTVSVLNFINAVEKPDLIQKITGGTLNRHYCHVCEQYGQQVNDQLMIFWPERKRPFYFVPAPDSSAEPLPDHVERFIQSLMTNLDAHTVDTRKVKGVTVRGAASFDDKFGPAWAEQMRVIPRKALRATIAAESLRESSTDLEMMLEAFNQTNSRSEARIVIESYHALLSNEALDQFEKRLNRAHASGDPSIQFLEARLQLLRSCKSFGISQAFTRLADLFFKKARQFRDSGNLAAAIKNCREALSILRRKDNPRQWALIQASLGNYLNFFFEGERADNLEQARHAYEAALQELTPDEESEIMKALYARLLTSLGAVFMERQRDDRVGNIERALELYSEAETVISREKEPRRYALLLCNYAIAYRNRLLGKKSENLGHAILACETALQNLPTDDSQEAKVNIFSTLGSILHERAELSPIHAQDIERAIDYYQQALRLLREPTDPSLHRAVLSGLGNAYIGRAKLLNQPEDYARAIRVQRRALRLVSSADFKIEWAQMMHNLGVSYKCRAELTSQSNDWQRAIHHFRKALKEFDPKSFPEDCRRTAGDLGKIYFAQRRWSRAVSVYRLALKSADILYEGSVLPTSKEVELESAAILHHRMAYALARIGRLREAAAVLENGRARSLSEALEKQQTDLSNVNQDPAQRRLRLFRIPNNLEEASLDREYHHNLQKLLQVESQERAALTGMLPTDIPVKLKALRQEARRLRNRLDSIVRQIRQIPDYQDFLKPADFADLQRVTQVGSALIYMFTTSAGSAAIFIYRPKDGGRAHTEVLWANDLTTKDLDELLHSDVNDSTQSDYLPGQLTGGKVLWNCLNYILPKIGRSLIVPVATRLAEIDVSHITLIPCGRLGLFPLHAACRRVDGQLDYPLKRFPIAYAPSARTLTACSKAIQPAKERQPTLVGVGNPKGLHFVREELEEVSQFFIAGERYILIEEPDVLDSLRQLLPSAVYLHLACHAQFDPEQPLKSRLELSPQSAWSLQEILDFDQLDSIRLAVLSACQTGLTDFRRVPDEMIGLPAGFLKAGASGVVSSLWPVDDLSTALLLARFYHYHLADSLDPATALCRAQHWLRKSTAKQLGLAKRYEQLYLESGRHDTRSFRAMRYYNHHPESMPFEHPLYWGGFIYTGATIITDAAR
jgi:CHAT domain-containing protein/tetratricopeptide (TPR) repeat protein